MNPSVHPSIVMLTALVVFVFGYAVLGAHLQRTWGVDPSRETPAAGHGRGRSAVFLLLGGLLCGAPPAALCGFAAAGLGVWRMLALIAGCALLLGVLRFALLFVSVRSGAARLAQIAAEALSAPAERIFHLLALTACTGVLAGLLHMANACLHGEAVSLAQTAVLSLAMLCVQHALAPCDLAASRLRGEGEEVWLSMGHTLILALVACAAGLLRGEAEMALRGLSLPDVRMIEAACMAAFLPAMEQLAHLGGRGLRGLFARPALIRKKPVPYAGFAAGVGVMALSAALCATPWMYLWQGMAACAPVLALLALVCCALWLRRVGRGLLL